jgi:CheY-like chemotaxis protein
MPFCRGFEGALALREARGPIAVARSRELSGVRPGSHRGMVHAASSSAHTRRESYFMLNEVLTANRDEITAPTPQRRSHGAGGLSTSAESVEARSGAVRVGGMPGIASVFGIDLQGPPAGAVISGPLDAHTGQRRRSCVLLAEDDEDEREAIALALRAIDIDADAVADGGRFLVAVASHYRGGAETRPIDLMVVDVIMPVCGGLAVLEALRTARWKTPVVVITGRETREVRHATERLGATLMIKPLDLTALQETVLRLLAGRPAH